MDSTLYGHMVQAGCRLRSKHKAFVLSPSPKGSVSGFISSRAILDSSGIAGGKLPVKRYSSSRILRALHVVRLACCEKKEAKILQKGACSLIYFIRKSNVEDAGIVAYGHVEEAVELDQRGCWECAGHPETDAAVHWIQITPAALSMNIIACM